MNEAKMQQIVGTGSILDMIITNIKQNILLDPTFKWCPDYSTLDMKQ